MTYIDYINSHAWACKEFPGITNLYDSNNDHFAWLLVSHQGKLGGKWKEYHTSRILLSVEDYLNIIDAVHYERTKGINHRISARYVANKGILPCEITTTNKNGYHRMVRTISFV